MRSDNRQQNGCDGEGRRLHRGTADQSAHLLPGLLVWVEEVIDDRIDCPRCERAAFLLGVLGELVYYRCRYCGFDFSVDREMEESITLLPVRPEEVSS